MLLVLWFHDIYVRLSLKGWLSVFGNRSRLRSESLNKRHLVGWWRFKCFTEKSNLSWAFLFESFTSRYSLFNSPVFCILLIGCLFDTLSIPILFSPCRNWFMKLSLTFLKIFIMLPSNTGSCILMNFTSLPSERFRNLFRISSTLLRFVLENVRVLVRLSIHLGLIGTSDELSISYDVIMSGEFPGQLRLLFLERQRWAYEGVRESWDFLRLIFNIEWMLQKVIAYFFIIFMSC